MDSRKIEFSREQYSLLLKLVYLGNWMANSHSEEPDKEVNQLEQYLYAQAKNLGLEDYVDYDLSEKKYAPSDDLEEELEPVITEYDDYTFWDELAWRMAERDFTARYDQAQILCMTTDEIFREKNIIADKYFDEFKTHGIEHLTLSR